MSAQPLACTRCGQPVEVVEHVEITVGYGLAMVDDSGVVRPASEVDPYGSKQDSAPLRAVAVCPNAACRNRWTLRRKFDPIPMESQ